MDESQSGKTNLPDLPDSKHDFWQHSDININEVAPLHPREEGHYFVRKSAILAQCEHCDWGFELDPGDQVIDGHLYTKEGKLVL